MDLHPVFQSLLNHSFINADIDPNDTEQLFREGLGATEHLKLYFMSECWWVSFRYGQKLYVAIGYSPTASDVEPMGLVERLERHLHGAVVFESSASDELIRQLFAQIVRDMMFSFMGHLDIDGDPSQFFS